MNNSLPPAHMTCPDTAHKKKCIDLCAACPKWIMLQGNNPNTGEPLNEWNCSDAWLPMLLIENSQMQKQTGAAVESLRNLVALGPEVNPPQEIVYNRKKNGKDVLEN